MPFVGAAVGAIGSAILGAGGAAVGLAGSALGGLATAGGSALGGLAAVGSSAIGGVTSLFAPGYGVTGGLIGPAEAPLTHTIGTIAQKVIPIAKTGAELFGMFKGSDDPKTTAQPTTTAALSD